MMTAAPHPEDCSGCAFLSRRWLGTTPRLVCKRYQRPATARCLDYVHRATVVQALKFYEAVAK